MKPQDIIEQLVGKFTAYDQVDDFTFIIHNCSKFNGAGCNISLVNGIVEVLGEVSGEPVQSFAIKAELVPL